MPRLILWGMTFVTMVMQSMIGQTERHRVHPEGCDILTFLRFDILNAIILLNFFYIYHLSIIDPAMPLQTTNYLIIVGNSNKFLVLNHNPSSVDITVIIG